MISEDLRERIARALGWTVAETKSFSLPSLREIVRTVNADLAARLDYEIRSGENLVGERRRPRRRR